MLAWQWNPTRQPARSWPADAVTTTSGGSSDDEIPSKPSPLTAARQAHLHADGGARRAVADLHQIAELVDHPQALVLQVVGERPVARQGVGELAAVMHLAADLAAV